MKAAEKRPADLSLLPATVLEWRRLLEERRKNWAEARRITLEIAKRREERS